jgi:hypothetical protein
MIEADEISQFRLVRIGWRVSYPGTNKGADESLIDFVFVPGQKRVEWEVLLFAARVSDMKVNLQPTSVSCETVIPSDLQTQWSTNPQSIAPSADVNPQPAPKRRIVEAGNGNQPPPPPRACTAAGTVLGIFKAPGASDYGVRIAVETDDARDRDRRGQVDVSYEGAGQTKSGSRSFNWSIPRGQRRVELSGSLRWGVYGAAEVAAAVVTKTTCD